MYFSVMEKAEQFKKHLLKDGTFINECSDFKKGEVNIGIEWCLYLEYSLWKKRIFHRIIDILPLPETLRLNIVTYIDDDSDKVFSLFYDRERFYSENE